MGQNHLLNLILRKWDAFEASDLCNVSFDNNNLIEPLPIF